MHVATTFQDKYYYIMHIAGPRILIITIFLSFLGLDKKSYQVRVALEFEIIH